MFYHSPLVSIIIPSFNREAYIAETLQSIQNQSYVNWEAIIVDDGSTDSSMDVVNQFSTQDNRIRLYTRNRLPKGAPVCRNIGAEYAKGEYIIFLDSDDILAPYCLKRRVEYFIAHPDNDALVFPMLIFNKRPGDTALLWSDYSGSDALSKFLQLQSPWQTTGPIWKKKAVLNIGGWNEEVLTWQDWEYHIKALVKGISYKIVDTLPDCFLRRDEQERISAGDMRLERLHSKLELFEKVFNIIPERQLYKPSFAHLFFNHAERTAIKWPNEKLAFSFHKKMIEYKLVPEYIYIITFFYISLLSLSMKMKLSLFTSFFYKVGHVILPKSLLKLSTGGNEPSVPGPVLMRVNNLMTKQNA